MSNSPEERPERPERRDSRPHGGGDRGGYRSGGRHAPRRSTWASAGIWADSHPGWWACLLIAIPVSTWFNLIRTLPLAPPRHWESRHMACIQIRTISGTLGHRSLATTTADADAVDDISLLGLITEAASLVRSRRARGTVKDVQLPKLYYALSAKFTECIAQVEGMGSHDPSRSRKLGSDRRSGKQSRLAHNRGMYQRTSQQRTRERKRTTSDCFFRWSSSTYLRAPILSAQAISEHVIQWWKLEEEWAIVIERFKTYRLLVGCDFTLGGLVESSSQTKIWAWCWVCRDCGLGQIYHSRDWSADTPERCFSWKIPPKPPTIAVYCTFRAPATNWVLSC